ncbi:MAG: ABC transporter ATP-binding protein, partial [Pseudomonadota bacterium]
MGRGPASDAPVLAAEGLTKRFGGLKAVDGMSLTLEKGEIVGVIGPNGAGKTTLFNLLAGALAPDTGRILIAGEPVTKLPAEARCTMGLVRTFQIPKPFADMTVLENTMVAGQEQAGETMIGALLSPFSVRRQDRALAKKAAEILEFLGLTRVKDDAASTLSGGQRKLLELARAMIADPDILLLDEPAAGVNPALMEFIMSRVEEINGDGVTVLLIEHNMSVVERLCRRVIAMAEGRHLTEG